MCFKFLFVFILFQSIFSQSQYDEKFRNQFHFSAPKGFINDPNGLVYHNGVYELYYQAVPYNKDGGRKFWGHARSTDLFHWENLRPAMNPILNENGHLVEIWSGSAIMDTKNLTGFQSSDKPRQTLLAFFAGHPDDDPEAVWLAYSTDGGVHFQYLDNNPVIQNPNFSDFGDFRDPKVIEYQDHYVAVVAETDHVSFYTSTDLVNWEQTSRWGDGIELTGGWSWECVDLFPLTYNDEEKWILIVNYAWRAFYFIGSFDGRTFTHENSDDTLYQVDYGQYSYAGVTYNSAPDNRRIFISWADDEHAGPTDPWRNIMTIPRDLKLIEVDGKPRLSSQPVKEIESLYTGKSKMLEQQLEANNPVILTDVSSSLLDLKVIIANVADKVPEGSVGVEFKGEKDSVRVYLTDQFYIDCRNANGLPGGSLADAPRLTNDFTLDMRIVLDISTIELFADNGLTVKNNQFYTEDAINKNIILFYEAPEGSKPLNITFSINEMKSSMR